MATPSCREVEPLLSQLVDGELPRDEEVRVRTHIRTCASCRDLFGDLERLRRAARQVGPITPPDHVWLELAGQMRRSNPRSVAPPRRRAPLWQWAGLTAALVVVTAGLYVVQRSQLVGTLPTADNPAPTGSVETVADELNLAAAHYEKAIAALEAMSKQSDNPMDAAVAAVVRDNLDAIDLAIAESRAALASNPESEPARDSLFEALRRKIAVLQTTVSLINEMRSGDPEGAQRAAETLGKKS